MDNFKDTYKNPSLIFKIVIAILVLGTSYMIGFGHGQESAYKKINDDIKTPIMRGE